MKTSVLIVIITTFLFHPSSAHGYGYKTISNDPLVISFKTMIVEGRAKNWEAVSAQIKNIETNLKNIKELFKKDLEGNLRSSIAEKNLKNLADALVRVVIFAIEEKLYWCEKENLHPYPVSRSRLKFASGYYAELLSGSVRKYDSLHSTNMHQTIMNEFNTAISALGSPGIFGVGMIPPDMKKFQRSKHNILNALSVTFGEDNK